MESFFRLAGKKPRGMHTCTSSFSYIGLWALVLGLRFCRLCLEIFGSRRHKIKDEKPKTKDRFIQEIFARRRRSPRAQKPMPRPGKQPASKDSPVGSFPRCSRLRRPL